MHQYILVTSLSQNHLQTTFLNYSYHLNACPDPQPNSSGWDLGQDGKLWNGRNGRSGKLSHSNDVIGACICSNDVNVCAHYGCMVNGSVAMAAF